MNQAVNPSAPRAARDIVDGFWRHANARDWESFGRLLDEGVVYTVPQTRERVRGREKYVEFNRTFPGEWRVEIVQLIAEATRVVTVIDFIDGDTVQTGISLFEVEAGHITHIVDYWPSPYEPPVRMTPHIERF